MFYTRVFVMPILVTRGVLPPVNRTEALSLVGWGWRGLLHRVFNAADAAHRPVLDVQPGWGRLEITVDESAPHDLLATIALVESAAVHRCEICAGRGENRHWDLSVDGPDAYPVLCSYHGWRTARGAGIDELDDEWRAVHRRAPASLRPLLLGAVPALLPDQFRAALRLIGECQIPDATHGYVWPEREIYVLREATPAQLAVCTPQDLAPFFADDDPEIREAAMLALARTRRA